MAQWVKRSSCSVGHSCSSDTVPGMGASINHGYDHKKKKSKDIYLLVYLIKSLPWDFDPEKEEQGHTCHTHMFCHWLFLLFVFLPLLPRLAALVIFVPI